MKVGDYVRFKTLSREIKIGKVIDIIEPDKESMKKYCVYDLDNNEATVDDYVIKSSPNIIDLIEVGDYVNGRYVDKYQGKLGNFCELPNGKWEFIEISNEHYLISSIATREQFESMKYKIGEDK